MSRLIYYKGTRGRSAAGFSTKGFTYVEAYDRDNPPVHWGMIGAIALRALVIAVGIKLFFVGLNALL